MQGACVNPVSLVNTELITPHTAHDTGPCLATHGTKIAKISIKDAVLNGLVVVSLKLPACTRCLKKNTTKNSTDLLKPMSHSILKDLVPVSDAFPLREGSGTHRRHLLVWITWHTCVQGLHWFLGELHISVSTQDEGIWIIGINTFSFKDCK